MGSKWCETWIGIDYWCGVKWIFEQKTGPFKEFNRGATSLQIEAELAVDIGVGVTLAFGVDNTFVTAKAGLKAELNPVAARLKALLGKNNCGHLSLGASACALGGQAALLGVSKSKEGAGRAMSPDRSRSQLRLTVS